MRRLRNLLLSFRCRRDYTLSTVSSAAMLLISLIAAAAVLATFLLLRSSSQKRSKVAAGDILSKEDVVYTARCKKILQDTVNNAPEGAIDTYKGQASMISSVRPHLLRPIALS